MRNYASLIIAVYNQLDFTKGCLDSLLRDRDRAPYEIIVIDNGSSDGTTEYLHSKARDLDRSDDRLLIITNEKNLGVAPAWNQGLQAATGKTIGILNNDILVTAGWYRSLLWALDYHKLGLVCPFTGNGPLDYELPVRAEAFTKKNLLKLWTNRYDFSAAIMTRATYEKIGLFDEKFIIGGYEDTDYCYRLNEADIKFGISGAAFIHHFGSQTLGEFKVRGDKHAAHNRDYFISKWKKDPSAALNTFQSKLSRSWKKFKLRWDLM